jgi:ATP-binding protein involved in chromosome partitioning
MLELGKETIEEALREIEEPYLGVDLVSAGAVRDIRFDGGNLRVAIELGFPAEGYRDELAARVRERLEQVPEVESVTVEVGSKIISHAVQRNLAPLPGVKNIIAVASGKGGVGKSTVAANLALALSAEGARAGLLDADIYGPSQPRMLGLTGQPTTKDGKHLEPMMGHGIQCMSIGFLVDQEQPMVWRGPMVTQALNQLMQTNWADLDYLIVDMPPGTGDIQLTLSQRVPVSGAVIVTTPQEISLLDARKGLRMFQKVEVNILGIIENMGTHVCSHCGHEEAIFGAGGGERLAAQYEVPFLGSLPLDRRVREETDGGNPSVVAEPGGSIAQRYLEIARKMAAQLVYLTGQAGEFPRIVVEE